MQFKLDKTRFAVLKDTDEIPDNFKQLFQDGYERRYSFVQDITERFQPKLNFTRNPVQIVRMPLAK